jgi:hypothetical protein
MAPDDSALDLHRLVVEWECATEFRQLLSIRMTGIVVAVLLLAVAHALPWIAPILILMVWIATLGAAALHEMHARQKVMRFFQSLSSVKR